MAIFPYRIQCLFVWLSRCTHSRGFGIQSPWAYRFVRYVVNEHYPYYGYSCLADRIIGISRLMRKLCLLYFRAANYCQPDLVMDYAPETDAFAVYFKAGCHNTEVLHIDEKSGGELLDGIITGENRTVLIRVSLVGNYRSFVDKAMDGINPKSVIILQGIKRDSETRRFWNEIKDDKRSGVTFDLYYCGIVFFDKKLYKQNYIVNF